MLSKLFASMNEHASIITCGFILALSGLFLISQIIENRKTKQIRKRVNDLCNLAQEQDVTIKHLNEELKRERSRTFAARTDCKRETAKRDRKIDALEYRLNQLLKADKD